MDSAFPVAEIINYKKIINNLSLPDQNDRHILAAAIKAKAEIIVTFNLKDFPPDYLSKYGIPPLHPDQFISELIIKDKEKVIQALSNQVHHKETTSIQRNCIANFRKLRTQKNRKKTKRIKCKQPTYQRKL